jgi:hypothetical protein
MALGNPWPKIKVNGAQQVAAAVSPKTLEATACTHAGTTASIATPIPLSIAQSK